MRSVAVERSYPADAWRADRAEAEARSRSFAEADSRAYEADMRVQEVEARMHNLVNSRK